MKRRSKNLVAVVVLLCQIMVTLGIEMDHREVIPFGASTPTVRTHDCGSNEIHKTLDSNCPCLPCCRASSFVASFNASPSVPSPTRELLAIPEGSRTIAVVLSSSILKRGPPIFQLG